MHENSFVLWKMNSPDRIIVLCKFITHTQFLRQTFSGQIHPVKRLMHCFHNGMIGKSGCQTIDWLQRIFFPVILFRRIKDLRMFHDKFVSFSHNLTAERNCTAFLKCITKIRHPEPDNLNRSGQIFHMHRRHLQAAAPGYLNTAKNHAVYCHYLSFSYIAYRHRLFIYIIASRIITEHISYRRNTNLRKQFFCFLSDSF